MKSKKHIILALLLISLAYGISHAADENTATATEPVISAVPVNVIEIEARVTEILDGGFVMLDRGAADGVATTTMFTLFKAAETVSADGTATRSVRFKTGELKAAEVAEKTTRAEVVKAGEPPAPGMTAVFLKLSPAPRLTKCKADTQFVAGGEFSYTPGSLQRDVGLIEKGSKTENTADFCIDVFPAPKPLSWTEANAACAERGMRLCTREEQHRACMTHNRKPPCKRDSGECSRGESLEGFNKTLEWSAMWTDVPHGGSEPEARTGSCSCTGATPACSACYNPECNGAAKKFRCCDDPE